MLKGDFLFQDILTLARLNISKVSYSLIGTVRANSHAWDALTVAAEESRFM